jgi:hypothetical protein
MVRQIDNFVLIVYYYFMSRESYPSFEEGPNRYVPEIDQPAPEQEDERPKPPIDQDPADSIY